MNLRPTALVLFAALFAFASAQNGHNQANWKLQAQFSNDVLGKFVYSSTVNPSWINESEKFWYLWTESTGKRFMIVDPKKKSKERAFDHVKLAAALSELSMKPYVAEQLPFNSISYNKEETAFTFTVERQAYEWDIKAETLKKTTAPAAQPGGQGPPQGGGGGGGGQGGQGGAQGNRPTFNEAPDDLAFVYMQGYNLFYGEKAKKEDNANDVTAVTQLTTDGEQFYEFRGSNYRTYTIGDKQERKTSVGASWSRDSKAFVIVRSDARKVGDLWVVNALATPRPTMEVYKYQMPGEANVEQSELYFFTRDDKKWQRVPVEKWKDQTIRGMHWVGKDHAKLRFTRRDRLQRNQELCEYDTATGEIKVIVYETVSNAQIEGQTGQRYVGEESTGDMVWWSERSGWGHLYMYSHDGQFKHAITSGPWRVDGILAVDEKKKRVYFSAVGREPGEDLYNTHNYSVGFDGKDLRLLDQGDADHTLRLSQSREFGVDSYSRIDLVPTSVVRDDEGKVVMELETMDLSRLEEVGWKMPERFVVKSEDGTTDIYGNMWKPFNFDPYKKYPIILHVYPGPQTESVIQNFSPNNGNQELANLGFVVVQIGNRGGTPQRSNAYHSYGYFNLRDYGLADKKAGVEQLARRHSWIDVERVGIFGHSGGGFMTAAALLVEPYNDFFKVGVSSAGNHDNNIYNANWSESNHGLRIVQGTAQGGAAGGAGGAGGGRGGRGGGGGEEPPFGEELADYSPLIERLQQQQKTEEELQRIGEKDTRFEIRVPTNTEVATNLKGKLLLVHGDIDNNVHPGNTVRLVDALIKANKRFDFMLMPGQRHGFGPMNSYFRQMLMEYFATHLMGDDYSRNASVESKGQ